MSASLPSPARPALRAVLSSPLFAAAAAVFAAAMVLALYTDHVWEDYYITYRSSKNLATGNGLVFNVGERLHTFTSPLGVLLPAMASLLTGNSSDTAALWIFRVMSAAALGGAAALALAAARRLGHPALAAALLVALLATDAKMLDFTINGMETGFMLLFTAYAFWAHFSPGPRQWAHLGAAWAGMMWSRPDSFLYIALLALAAWLFNDPARSGADRRTLFLLFLRAGLLTTALYLPWFLWAWWYYGSPVPHTIVAKGAISVHNNVPARLLENVWRMPWVIWEGKTAAEGAFLPPYYMFPEWPAWMLPFGRALAMVSMVLWLVPRVRSEVRVASFAYFGGAAYLSFVPYFPFPWYFPTTTLLAFLALTGAAAPLLASSHRWARGVVLALGAVTLTGALALTTGMARQMKAQQALVETGNRRVIGEWLRDHAQPGDTVFMEPLGYIGFFSGMRTLDWPGLSSLEVVNAAKLVGTNWDGIIRYLQPNWLVMRVAGEGDLPKVSPHLARYGYDRVRDFDRTADIAALDVPGRRFLEFDAHYVLYMRRAPFRQDEDGFEISSPFKSNHFLVDDTEVRVVHAPGQLVAPVPAGARQVSLTYGMVPGAGSGDRATDGVTFDVWFFDGKRRHPLFSRLVAPAHDPTHVPPQHVTLELPPAVKPDRARLVLETHAGQSAEQDWSYWSAPRFQ